MVAAITANSYGTFDRAGAPCFAAVFQFADPATAQSGRRRRCCLGGGASRRFVGGGNPIDFTTIQVVGCDPGTRSRSLSMPVGSTR